MNVLMDDDGDVVYGEDVDENDPWLVAARELTPDKSLTRSGARAKYAVSTISVIGSALTALGFVSANSLLAAGVSRLLVALGVVSALLAVILALTYLVVSVDRLNMFDLVDVQRWYERQLRRTWLVSVAGVLLLLGVVLAGAAGIIALLADQSRIATASLVVSGTVERTLSMDVTVDNAPAGSMVEARVIGDLGGSHVAIIRSRARADGLGVVEIAEVVEKVPELKSATLTVHVAGKERATVAMP